jgi:DNA mismatch repair ATPase MutS
MLAANPSTDVATIEARLDLVETFLKDESLRQDIVALLKNTHDSQRIVQKFSLGRGDADDLVALARTIEATYSVLQRLGETQQRKFDTIIARLEVPLDLAEIILKSIDEEGLRRQQHEVADVAANMGEPPSTDEISESRDVIDGLVGEVLEAGAAEKRGRKKRISRGIQNAIAKGVQAEPDGEETWIMKKTFASLSRNRHTEEYANLDQGESVLERSTCAITRAMGGKGTS